MSETPTNNANESASSEAQETSVEATPTQTNETAQSTPESIPENWEYTGDRKSVPAPFQNYVKGIDRYWSNKSKALAELGQKVKEYEDLRASDEWKSFEQFRQTANKRESAPVQPGETVEITQDEMDAIALGDAKTLSAVVERKAKALLESSVTPLAHRQKAIEVAENLKEFTALHPDFVELLESPAGELMIDAAQRGVGLEEIYKRVKEAESYFEQKGGTKRKQAADEKKAGSVVGRSLSGTSDVVYADNEEEAKRLSIALTLKGDKRQVHVRRK